MPITDDTTIETSHKGNVRQREIDEGIAKVRSVADRCRERVHHIEMRVVREPNPARQRPVIAEATLDVDGSPVRAHVAAVSVPEAVDLLVDRLKRRIAEHEDRRHRLAERRRTGYSGPGEWRHGDLRTEQPEYLDLPFDEREVRRHKTFAMEPMSVEEALFDLEQLGHDFYLFVEASTGADAMVRARDGVLEVVCATDSELPSADGVDRVRTAPPTLDIVSAKEQLEASGQQSIFFIAEDTGRGSVLYRRYDGHYGLVTPR